MECADERESVLRRWMEYFEELMNEENERERRLEEKRVEKIGLSQCLNDLQDM